MALPPAFLDELRARTPLPAIVGRRVKLARSGRDWKGCCPFHGEKTPSFHVYDDHFHCYGCGAHGDAIGFVMQSQGASFPEAVEQLAAEAGLTVPREAPGEAERERRRHDLRSALDAAAASFQRRLFLPEGRVALDYLRGRGLADDTIRRFGLGWSGEQRGTLAADLARDGVDEALMIEAGLLRRHEDTGRVSDFYFGRVMFPIRDRRGRTISFGGRILGDGQPKYVNGPETPLFSKRRSLYALDLAREGTRRPGTELVVAEGYMDVVALHQAGFAGAVAPLGTALTAEQLEEIWRLVPSPVLCFDGDAAGARAAARAAEIALPLLAPDRTLRIATLPAGEDPDTLVRKRGEAAFAAVLSAARPLAQALFDLLREGAGEETPEQRAALRTRLETAAARIPDRALAQEYRAALLDRFFAARRARRPPLRAGGTGTSAFAPASGPARSRPAPPRPRPVGAEADAQRARILVAILLAHPGLRHDLEHAFAQLDLPEPLRRLRDAILDAADALDSTALISHLSHLGLDDDVALALSPLPVPLPACAAPEAMPAEAEAGWWHYFGLMAGVDRLDEEVAALGRELTAAWDKRTEARLVALCAVRNQLRAGEQGAGAEP